MRRGALLALLLVPSVGTAAPDPARPGPFAVGTTALVVSRTSSTSGEPRPLDTAIWYPAVRAGATGSVQPATDARVARGRWPLVVFSHGLCGDPRNHEFLTRALASWGVVVAAPPHPGGRFADLPGCLRTVADSYVNRPDDVRAALDALVAADRDPASRFHRRLRAGRMAVAGVSFGGQTAIRVAALDARVRAVVAFAPGLFGPGLAELVVDVPALVMVGDVDTFAPLETQARPYFELLRGPRTLALLHHTGHFAYTDRCTFGAGRPDCAPGTLSQDDANTLVLRQAVPFLLRHLRGARPWARLLRPSATPDGVTVLARATG